MSDAYMNGTGLKERTRQLTDTMWKAFDCAILGGVIGAITIVIIVAALITPFYTLALAALPLAYLSWRLHQPWMAAMRALNKHRERMEAETTKRGKGWARS